MLKYLIDMAAVLLDNSHFHAIITLATWSVIVSALTLGIREIISLWKSMGDKVSPVELMGFMNLIEARLIRLENKFFRKAMTDIEAKRYYDIKNGRIKNKK